MVSPEERALTKVSADLTRYLRHCALEITDLLFSKELVPEDLHMKVTEHSSAMRDVVICLIGRVKNNPGEFVQILEALEKVPSLASICKTLRKSYVDFGGTLPLPPLPPEPVPQVEETVQPAVTSAVRITNTSTSASTGTAAHYPSPLPLGYKSSTAALCLVIAVLVACYYGLSDHRPNSDPPNTANPPNTAGPLNSRHQTRANSNPPIAANSNPPIAANSNPPIAANSGPLNSECHKLRSGNRLSLEKYLDQASESPTDTERLCKDYLLLDNCNTLKRDGQLNPFYLAKSYLEQKPRACWEDIVGVFCELSKNTLALEVAEEYHVDTRHLKCDSL